MAYAASTTTRDAKYADGKLISMKMDAVKIAAGTFVVADASAGYATNTPSASRPYFGVAYETIDNSAGTAGDLEIRVCTEGDFEFEATGTADQTWVGKVAYMSSGSSGNNKTVVISDPGVGPIVGRVTRFISATKVRVRITGYAFESDSEGS